MKTIELSPPEDDEEYDFAIVIQLTNDDREIVIQAGCRKLNSSWIVFEFDGEPLHVGALFTFPAIYAKPLQTGIALTLHHCPDE